MAEKPEIIEKNFLSKFPKESRPDSSLFEYPIPVLIQSGNGFTVNKFNNNSD